MDVMFRNGERQLIMATTWKQIVYNNPMTTRCQVIVNAIEGAKGINLRHIYVVIDYTTILKKVHVKLLTEKDTKLNNKPHT